MHEKTTHTNFMITSLFHIHIPLNDQTFHKHEEIHRDVMIQVHLVHLVHFVHLVEISRDISKSNTLSEMTAVLRSELDAKHTLCRRRLFDESPETNGPCLVFIFFIETHSHIIRVW